MPSKYEYVVDDGRLPAIADEIVAAPIIALDLETHGLSPVQGATIRLCSINTGKGVYVIDFFRCKNLQPIIDALRDSKGIKVGQNLKFDQKFLLYYHDLELWPVFDTFRASEIMHCGRDNIGHNLWDLYRRELKHEPDVQDLGGSDWSAPLLTPAQLDYAADDVIRLPQLREVMKPKLEKKGLNHIALVEFGAILPEVAVELSGFRLDPDLWRTVYNENIVNLRMSESLLLNALPDPTGQVSLPGFSPSWNLGSPDLMLKALRQMGMIIADTKETTLAQFGDDYSVIDKIINWRSYETQTTSFGLKFLKEINQATGKIHPDYWGFLKSGRYACRNPNLAQIPREEKFRKCFVPPPGRRLVICDYSNIEMRIVAEISGDEVLISVFLEGARNPGSRQGDAHYYTASILSGKKIEDIVKAERQQAKPVNFGFIYGMMPDKLVLYAKTGYGVSLTKKQASDFRKRYFERYSGVNRWHSRVQRDSKRVRETRTIGGRLRYIDNPDAYNEFYNTPVQGTGADGLKRALREVYFAFKAILGRPPCRTMSCQNPPIMLSHHVHDEVILDIDDNPELDKLAQETLSAAMIKGMQPYLKKVPVEAEASSGLSWADK